MNERIKQLVDEATIKTSHKYHTWGDRIATETKEVFDKEKFAELIVRECADLFEIEWGDEKLTGNDVGYVVKKHFGVERI